MRHFRTDDPKLNPTMRVDARQPRRDHRAIRADAADPIRDAQDVTAARRDAALADVKSQHKRKRGFSREDMRQSPKPSEPAMDAEAAAEAIKAQSKGAKA